MFKKLSLFVAVCAVGTQTVSAMFPSRRRGGDGVAGHARVWRGALSPDDRGVEVTEEEDYVGMSEFVDGVGVELAARYSLGAADLDPELKGQLTSFLEMFFNQPATRAILAQRYGLASEIANTHTIRAAWALERATRLAWIECFRGYLKEVCGGELVGDATGRVISFKIPGMSYVFSLRSQPYALGHYYIYTEPSQLKPEDEERERPARARDGYACNPFCTPTLEQSVIPSPINVFSRVHYARFGRDFVAATGIDNVQFLNHWVYMLPSADGVLDDETLVVVGEDLSEIDLEFHESHLADFRAKYTQESLGALAEADVVSLDDSLAANLAKVIKACGLWCFDDPNHFVFVRDDSVAGGVKVVMRFQEYPGFGGGKAAFFPRASADQIAANARTGFKSLLGIE